MVEDKQNKMKPKKIVGGIKDSNKLADAINEEIKVKEKKAKEVKKVKEVKKEEVKKEETFDEKIERYKEELEAFIKQSDKGVMLATLLGTTYPRRAELFGMLVLKKTLKEINEMNFVGVFIEEAYRVLLKKGFTQADLSDIKEL